MYVCVHVCMYVCMYVCMCESRIANSVYLSSPTVCMYVYMYIWLYACDHVSVYVHNVFMYVCMYVCVSHARHRSKNTSELSSPTVCIVCMYVCMSSCMYVLWVHACDNVCMYSHFHNDCLFLSIKKTILIPNAENKDRTGAFWLRNWAWVFFMEKKKDSHYENESINI